MVIVVDEITTSKAVEAYQSIKKAFKNFVEAKMVADEKCYYELTLKDELRNKLVFIGCLTSGYYGEGCHGTLAVLKDAGFDNVTEKFIGQNRNFNIKK